MNRRNTIIYLSTIGLCLLSAISCDRTKYETESVAQPKISFKLDSKELETKGTPVTNENLLELKGSLNISAYNVDDFSALFSEKELSYDATKGLWLIEDNPSWPDDEEKSLSFWVWSDQGEEAGKINPVIDGESKSMTFSYSVPVAEESGTSAEVQPDILFAQVSKNHVQCPAGTVNINMKHILSGLNFEVDPNVKDGVLNSITISDVYGSGDCVFDGGDFYWTPTGDKCSFTQNFDIEYDGGKDITAEDVSKTFMMIPQTLSGAKITISYTLDGTTDPEVLTASFPDKDAWNPGDLNMYVIASDGIRYKATVLPWNEGTDKSLPLETQYYSFELQNNDFLFTNTAATEKQTFSISSYVTYSGRGTSKNNTVLNFDADYSVDGGATWLPFDEAAAALTGISGLSATGNAGYAGFKTYTLTSAVRATEAISQYHWADDPITASNWDLSKCSIGGEYVASNPVNTANCYIVKHPGTYTIPCVYGNAIKNGTPSTTGYKYPLETQNVHILQHFLNAKGEAIASPYVLADVECSSPKAALMWCDAKDESGNLLIQNVTLNNAANPQSAYISFSTMDKATMIEGNAVLVLYDDVNGDGHYSPNNTSMTDYASLISEDVALWSWHIWVSSADLSADNAFVIDSDVLATDHCALMTKPLGWAAPNGSTRYYREVTSFIIRLTQNDSSAEPLYINISQPDIVLDNSASPVYYQGGRKDPFVGGYISGSSYVNKEMYGDVTAIVAAKDAKVFPTDKTEPTAIRTIGMIISRPDLMDEYSNYGLDNFYLNYWSMENSFGFEHNKPVVKTVYDPCPYGYSVTTGRQFRNITKDDVAQIKDYGFLFKKSLFLPYTSYRSVAVPPVLYSSGKTYSCFWTSNPYKDFLRQHYLKIYSSNTIALGSGTYFYRNFALAVMPSLEQITE